MRPVDGGRAMPVRHAPDPMMSAAAESRTPTAGGSRTPAAGTVAAIRPVRSRPRALLALSRPKQWVKNALVIAAPGAAGALGHDDVPGRGIVAGGAFCLIPGSIYALNDVRDRHEDRRHPRKRMRPVAAGEVEPREAVAFGIVRMRS